MYGVSLDWPRCIDGAELETLPLGAYPGGFYDEFLDPIDEAHALAQSAIQYRSSRIASAQYDFLGGVLGGGRTEFPLENPLALRFLNARSDRQLTDFVGRFGFPVFPHGRLMMAINIRHYQVRLREIADRATSENPADLVNLSLAFHRFDPGDPAERLSPLSVEPFLDPPKAGARNPLFGFKTKALFDFMCLEIVAVAANGARLGTCEMDGMLFFTGSFTGRGATKRYCSDRCRVAAMRKRSKERAAGSQDLFVTFSQNSN